MKSDSVPKYNILYLLLLPVIVLPMLAITILVIRGDKTGQLYNLGLEAANSGDYAAAVSAWDEAAGLGHAESAYDLAILYRSGLVEVENSAEMIRFNFQRAANSGLPAAEYELGRISELSPVPDYDLAAMHYRRAALSGNVDGLLAMGRLHRDGLGVNQSSILSWGFYEQAALHGSHEAEVEMALLLISGDMEKIDYIAAEKYLLRAEQSQPDSPEAREKAGDYYRQAAELSDPDGLVNYGDYLVRRGRGSEAVKFYEQAAEKLDFSPAQHRLGMYFYKQTPPDYRRSRSYFERAAARGNAASWINLGIMFELGQGGEVNIKSAIECYEMAEKLGHPDAVERLRTARENSADSRQQD